jgi:hypothetical protein
MVPARLGRALARVRHIMSSPVADWVVKVAVLVSVVVSGFAAWRLQDLADCVARYNDATSARTVALTQAADEERSAERKADDAQAALFLSPLLTKPSERVTSQDRLELLRLLRSYQAALSDQKKERADADGARRVHPIPDPPSEVCG